jgi:hypothetical protein
VVSLCGVAVEPCGVAVDPGGVLVAPASLLLLIFPLFGVVVEGVAVPDGDTVVELLVVPGCVVPALGIPGELLGLVDGPGVPVAELGD